MFMTDTNGFQIFLFCIWVNSRTKSHGGYAEPSVFISLMQVNKAILLWEAADNTCGFSSPA